MRALSLSLCRDAVGCRMGIVGIRRQGYGARTLPLPTRDNGGRLVGAVWAGAGAEERCRGAENEVGVDAAGRGQSYCSGESLR